MTITEGFLDHPVFKLVSDTAKELDVKYIAITNGPKTFIFERTAEGWQFMQKAPLWEEMAGRES